MSQTYLVIVADDSIVRLDLRELLQALGYGVVGEAGDGPWAITLARQLRQSP
jgi:response regulator NasT